MKTVVGLFERYQEAEQAINQLTSYGFRKQDISVIVRDSSVERPIGTDNHELVEDASIGALGGTAVGGLAGMLVGLGTLTIPGIGAVIAAGTITSALTTAVAGASVGAVAGGLIGVLIGLGVPEDAAKAYAEGVQRGGVLVAITAETPQANDAYAILNQAHAMNIDTRQSSI